MILSKARQKKNDRIFLSKSVVTIRAWKSLELNSTANSGTTSTITHGPLIIFILHRISILLRPLYRMELPFLSFLFSLSFFLRANIWGQPLNITGVKQDGRKRGVSYRTGRFVNGVNFFNPPRGCFLRFNSRPTRILMGAPLSTIFQPFSRLLTDETFAYDREFTRISSN